MNGKRQPFSGFAPAIAQTELGPERAADDGRLEDRGARPVEAAAELRRQPAGQIWFEKQRHSSMMIGDLIHETRDGGVKGIQTIIS